MLQFEYGLFSKIIQDFNTKSYANYIKMVET